MGMSKRTFLQAASLLVADRLLAFGQGGVGTERGKGSGHKAVLVIFGGVRYQETFSREGAGNIPRMLGELAPKSLFYQRARNEGVTAHYNAIASILTGNWQRVDDWGKLPPASPTLFEYLRKQCHIPPSDVWMVSSNKALTRLIGASSDSSYGPAFGANVVFPKQLLIEAVVHAIWAGRTGAMADPKKVQAELEATLEGTNYEGLGWSVFDDASQLDPRTRMTITDAVASFVRGGEPKTGDELTFMVAREVMRKFAPSLLVINFSDVEVAHFGAFSLHLAGIRTVDELTFQIWREIEANPEYQGRTTMVVMPEFGRDPDGSSTNGFFNHRSEGDSCRTTWMMCLGEAVERPQVIDSPVRHIDLCPTLSRLLGCRSNGVQGQMLPGWKV